ncbi:hypothetical protein AXF13_03120 [Desulfovibrio fairfieldensis]|uniref:Uncharacterized protein n=2 Tax=Desulfovibrionaceae TaxID=194924 RepID=A0A0X8JI04_9BACT|nr:hypothetical protein AXF13_03120 [Desulfovibrio fairfieldensis]
MLPSMIPLFREIRPFFRLSGMLLLLSAAIPASAQDFGWFELDIPPGWQVEEPRRLGGTWVLSLRNAEAGSQVSILVGKTAGPPDAADVAGLLRAATGVPEPARRLNGRWLFAGKDVQGVDTACVVSADRKAGLYLAVLRSGGAAPAEALLAGLRSKKYPALLPR